MHRKEMSYFVTENGEPQFMSPMYFSFRVRPLDYFLKGLELVLFIVPGFYLARMIIETVVQGAKIIHQCATLVLTVTLIQEM